MILYVIFFSLRRRRRLLLLFTVHTGETSAGIMCYINQVTHSVGYPRFVFTNNTPYGRPSNNNILVRFDTFCSLRRNASNSMRTWWCDPFRNRRCLYLCVELLKRGCVRYSFISFAQWICP